MKRTLLLLLLILSLSLSAVSPAFADSADFATGPSITGGASILMDATNGSVLCGKNVDERMYPASLTKIMTAILAIELLDLDDMVLIDDEVVSTQIGWRDIKLSTSDSIKVEDAIYLLLTESNNAIAAALAKTAAGSISAFAEKMNARAAELGCSDTHFVNPHGLHDDDQYTTARDLAVMTQYALTLPLFVKAAGADGYPFPKTKKSAARELTNTNWLVNGNDRYLYVKGTKQAVKYDDLLCGKTGTTDEAGGCLMSVAERDGTRLIAVTLDAGDKNSGYVSRFVDLTIYFDWGFSNFHTVKAMNKDALLGKASVKRGATLDVDVIASSDQYVTLKLTEDVSSITHKAEIFDTLLAPVKAGEIAGTYKLYAGDTLIGEYPCITANDVPEGGFLSRFGIPDAKAYRIYRTIALVFVGLSAVSLLGLIVSLFGGGRTRRRPRVRRRAQF